MAEVKTDFIKGDIVKGEGLNGAYVILKLYFNEEEEKGYARLWAYNDKNIIIHAPLRILRPAFGKVEIDNTIQ